MKYKISKEAARDLREIWLYTLRTWSEEQADRYYGLLLDEIEYVAGNPSAGKAQGHIRKGYFRTQVKAHYIFYRVNSVENVVEIIRILHQRMDIEARLEIEP